MKKWEDMTRDEQLAVLSRMGAYGGSFVALLSDAWRLADEVNAQRLAAAFPELVAEYAK